MLYNDHITQFTGQQIDEAITIALGLNPGENGWLKILSTEDNQIDLDTIKNPGNYTINYTYNGSVMMEDVKPINLSVILINNELFQFSLIWDRIEYRIYNENGDEWGDWVSAKSSSYIYQQETPPLLPEDNSIWINTLIYEMSVWDGNGWVSVAPQDIMKRSIYDTESANMDIYEYIDNLINLLRSEILGHISDSDLYDHIENTIIHVTSEEKDEWSSKVSPEEATQGINIALTESKDYTDTKFNEMEDIVEGINTDLTDLTDDFNAHKNNNNIHVSPEERISWDSKAEGDHTHITDGRVKIDAEDIVSGTLPLERIPHGALERIVKVPDNDAMYALTTNEVQNGDSVYVEISEDFYYVIDETKLNIPGGYMLYSTGVASSVLWSNIQNKPTTLSGYGITDAYTKIELDNLLTNLEVNLQIYICVIYDTEMVNTEMIEPSDMINDNGLYILVGYGESSVGEVKTSIDGLNWVTQNIPTTTRLRSIIKGNNLYVAVGNNGTIITSANTTSWTKRTISGVTNGFNDVMYNDNLYVAVGEAGTIATSTNGTSWTKRTAPNSQTLESIIYANNQYIVVGRYTILTSLDGITWTEVYNGDVILYDIIYFDNKYIAVGEKEINDGDNIVGVIITSIDGITWIEQEHDFEDEWFNNIKIIDDGYIMHGSMDNIYAYSNTLERWFAKYGYDKEGIVTTNMIKLGSNYSLLYEDGTILYFSIKFDTIPPTIDDLQVRAEVVEEKLDEIYYNDNELQVIIDKLPNVVSIIDMIHFDDNYYLLAECEEHDLESGWFVYYAIFKSSNGLLWDFMIQPYIGDDKPYKLGHVESRLLLFASFSSEGMGGNLYSLYSEGYGDYFDQWFDIEKSDVPYISSLIYKDNKCYAWGKAGGWFEDGQWTQDINGIKISLLDGYLNIEPLDAAILNEKYYDFNDVIYIDNKFCAAANGAILSSTDAQNWTKINTDWGEDVRFIQISGSSGNYIATGFKNSGKYIFHSSDGILWNNYETDDNLWEIVYNGTYRSIEKIIYANGSYMGIGVQMDDIRTLITSSDMENWDILNVGVEDFEPKDVIYDNNQYVSVGYNGKILTSPDGILWTSRTTGTVYSLNKIIYANSQYVVVGAGPDGILTSPDGISWSIHYQGLTYDLYSIIYANNLYIAVGDSGTIVTSPDGDIWTKRDSPYAYTLNDIAYGNNTFVIAGAWAGSITSTDGITWTLNNNELKDFRNIEFINNRFIGGRDVICSSVDGLHWKSESLYLNNPDSYFQASNTNNINNRTVISGGYPDYESSIIIIEPDLPTNKFGKITYHNDKFITFGQNPHTKNLTIGASINSVDWLWEETYIPVSYIVNVYYNEDLKSFTIIDSNKLIVNIEERENVKLINNSLNDALQIYPELPLVDIAMGEIESNLTMIYNILYDIEEYTGPLVDGGQVQ